MAIAGGGQTRGDNQALDHDMGQVDKAIPCGIVNEDSGVLFLGFGKSCKTSDFIVDNLNGWWDSLTAQQQTATATIQIKVDNGSESSGVRTQFLSRLVDWADEIGKTLHLLYFPPYHSKYNPIVNGVGAFSNGTGMGRNSSTGPPSWLGPKA